MKRFIFAALVIVSSIVNASETVVLEATLPIMSQGRAMADSKFYMDTKTGEGFVKASVAEERLVRWPSPICHYDQWGRCIPTYNYPRTEYVTVYADTVKVPGLMMNGDDAVFSAPEGNIVCGTIKPSRVFKVPTLYLSGNCKLVEKISNNKLTITLKTK